VCKRYKDKNLKKNRIEWQAWHPEYFAKAKAEDKALFVFVGHRGCSWCEQMEQESFLDEEIVGLIQRDFIPVRVDSYERPDIGRYLHALFTQMTGREANDPLCLFLSPEQVPLYSATYMPDRDRDGMMGLRETLELVGKKYQEQRSLLLNKGKEVLESMPKSIESKQATKLDATVRSLVSEQIQMRYDNEYGGFEGAPKFPRHSVLMLLTELLEKRQDSALKKILVHTLDAMTGKALRDDRDGGFYHYCTDAGWEKPSHGKLLYDNALMVQVLLNASRVLGEAQYRTYALQTVHFLQSHLIKNGLFTALYDEGIVQERRIIVSWNAMAVTSLFLAGEHDRVYHQLAIETLGKLLEQGMKEGRLYHSFLPGESPETEAFLEDYAHVADALIVAYEQTNEEHYLVKASELINEALKRFFHAGLWQYNEGEMAREDDPKDTVYPSALAVMTSVLHKAAKLIDPAYEKFMHRTLEVHSYTLMREPISMPQLSRVLLATV